MPSGELRIIAFGIFQYILVIACIFTHIILIMCIHKGIVRRAALGVAAGKEQEGAEVGQRKCVGGIARQHAAVHALRFLGTENKQGRDNRSQSPMGTEDRARRESDPVRYV
jgi:hypothetical protein